jgi:hypothetical protein
VILPSFLTEALSMATFVTTSEVMQSVSDRATVYSSSKHPTSYPTAILRFKQTAFETVSAYQQWARTRLFHQGYFQGLPYYRNGGLDLGIGSKQRGLDSRASDRTTIDEQMLNVDKFGQGITADLPRFSNGEHLCPWICQSLNLLV